MVEKSDGGKYELPEVRHRLVTTLLHLLPPASLFPASRSPPSLPPATPAHASSFSLSQGHTQLTRLSALSSPCNCLVETTSFSWATCSDSLLSVVSPGLTSPSGFRCDIVVILKNNQEMWPFLCLWLYA